MTIVKRETSRRVGTSFAPTVYPRVHKIVPTLPTNA